MASFSSARLSVIGKLLVARLEIHLIPETQAHAKEFWVSDVSNSTESGNYTQLPRKNTPDSNCIKSRSH
jgi:hypothetical protein